MAKQIEKKKFYQVEIPLLNKEIELFGREGSFKGKHVKYDLTNSLKGKGLEIKFVVEEKDGKISTKVKQAYLHGFYIRRMLRKGTDYVEDSFLAECKDNRIRIKPFMITRKRVSRIVLKGLRNKAKEEIEKYVKGKSFEMIVKDVMDGKLQKDITPALKKIYPLGLVEIKFVGIENLKEHELYEQEQDVKETKRKKEESTVDKKVEPKEKPAESSDSSVSKTDSTDSEKEKEDE
jgi:ribosomal protein S3AE